MRQCIGVRATFGILDDSHSDHIKIRLSERAI